MGNEGGGDERIVACLITDEALTDHFGSSGQETWLNAFESNRLEIEAVASDKFDKEGRPASVRLDSADFS